MVIEHKLEFSSTSHHIKNFISKFIREVNIDGYTYMRDGNIFTVVDSDEDSIKNFFEYLSLNLPQSIFMGESTFRELDSMYRVESLSDKTKIDIGLCPKCSQNISDNITSIFTNCWHCGPNYTMKIKPKKLIYKDSQNQIIDMVDDILNGENIKVDTFFGSRIFSKDISNRVLITNQNSLEKYFHISKKDIEILFSIEKPFVRVFDKDNKIKEIIAPYDGITISLAKEFQKRGIDYINISDNNYSNYAKFDIEPSRVQRDLVVQNIRDRLFILDGDRSIIPNIQAINSKTISFANDLVSFMVDTGEYRTDYIDDIDKFFGTKFVALTGTKMDNIDSYYTEIETSILNILFENNILGSDTIHIHISSDDTSITIKKDNNFKRVWEMGELKDIKNSISSIDDNSKKLLEKVNIDFVDGKSIQGLLENIYKIIDINNIEESSFGENSSLKLDFFSQKNDIAILDYSRLLRSIISFKVADVDSKILAYSFLDGFVEYLDKLLNEIKDSFNCDIVTISGDMLKNQILNSRIQKKLLKHNPKFAIAYPINMSVIGGVFYEN